MVAWRPGGFGAKRGEQAGVIGGAVMIDVVGAERGAREAAEQIIFFVGGVIRADHADGGSAVSSRTCFRRRATSSSASSQVTGSSLPLRRTSGWRMRSGLRGEIEAEAAFAAEKFAVDAGLIAIIGAKDFVVADAEGGLAAIRAMGAGRGNVRHFPWPRLVTIGAAGERADRANIDAHAALFAVQLAGMLGRMTDCTPRAPTPSAFTSMPSSQTRTQRKQRMQRGAS